MSLRLLAGVVSAVLGAAGCYAPAPPAGAPCANADLSAGRCPDGLACVRSEAGGETCEPTLPPIVVDAAIDAPPLDPLADEDGDGVLNGVDNCVTVENAEQGDEDGDLVGDRCDPCPIVAGGDDTDADGVGDACDPRPESPGDRIVVFEGFVTGLVSTWQTNGEISVGRGTARFEAGAGETISLSRPAPDTQALEVRALVVLDNLQAVGMDLGSVSLVERFSAFADTGYACQLSALRTGTQAQLRIFDLGTAAVLDTAAHPFDERVEYELRLRRVRADVACRATAPVLELAKATPAVGAVGNVGIRVRAAKLDVAWVMVVSSP